MVPLFLGVFVAVTCTSAFPLHRIKRDDSHNTAVEINDPQMKLLKNFAGVSYTPLYPEDDGKRITYNLERINTTRPGSSKRRRRITTLLPNITAFTIQDVDVGEVNTTRPHAKRRRRTTTLLPNITAFTMQSIKEQTNSTTHSKRPNMAGRKRRTTTMLPNITAFAKEDVNSTEADYKEFNGTMENATYPFAQNVSSLNSTFPALENATDANLEAVLDDFVGTNQTNTTDYSTNFTETTFENLTTQVNLMAGATDVPDESEDKGKCREANGKSCLQCAKIGPNCHYSHFTKRCFFSKLMHPNKNYECGERSFYAVDSFKSLLTLIVIIVTSFFFVVIGVLYLRKANGNQQAAQRNSSHVSNALTDSNEQQKSESPLPSSSILSKED